MLRLYFSCFFRRNVKVIFILGRIHPGESPASFVVQAHSHPCCHLFICSPAHSNPCCYSFICSSAGTLSSMLFFIQHWVYVVLAKYCHCCLYCGQKYSYGFVLYFCKDRLFEDKVEPMLHSFVVRAHS